MTPSAAAAHRLVSTLPLQSLPDLVSSAPFAFPCHDDEGRDLVFSALRNPDWKTARAHNLVFSDLRNPDWKTAHAHKEAAQSALLTWLSRKDVDPFAPQLLRSPTSKAKKGAPKEKTYASSFQLALELGLESLAIGMLSSATPERLAALRASEQGRQVLEVALAKNMVGLVKEAAESGWEVSHVNAKGRSVMWQARSVEAVQVLLDAGLPAESLSEPGLVEALSESLPQKQIQPWLQLLESHFSPASLVGPKLHALLERLPAQLQGVWDSRSIQIMRRLFAERQSIQDFLASSASELPGARVSVARGLFKGELTPTAILARFASRDRLMPAVGGLLHGQVENVLSGPAHYVRPGVTDKGLLALFSPSLSELDMDNELQNATFGDDKRWWSQCLASQEAILALHSPQQWLEWKIETAATLSKTPNAELATALSGWVYRLGKAVEDDEDNPLATAKKAMDELELALSRGVAFVGSGSRENVESWLQWIVVAAEGQADYEAAMAQRDRLVIALLGNEARYAASLASWGRQPSPAWSDSDVAANPYTLFTPESLARVWENPHLAAHIKRGLTQAIERNAPNAPALKQALLEGRLKPAEPASAPRPRL